MAHTSGHRILPFRIGGDPSFPLAPTLGRPFNSRVESELDFEGGVTPKNYQFVAFRPGWPLQASELNEMQEHFQMQLTLSIAMMNNWITSSAGPMWGGSNQRQPGDGDVGYSGIPNTGLGVGGSGTGTHTQSVAISGPGWRGSTPLHPFSSPYSGIAGGGALQPVTVENMVTQQAIRLQFNSGWWLVELPPNNPDSGEYGDETSGLKHWVYLDTTTDGSSPSDAFQVDIPYTGAWNRDVWVPVGLNLASSYYRCCTENDDPLTPCDPELGDNAAGFSNDRACGADRYSIGAIGATTPSTNDWPDSESDWGTTTNPDGAWREMSLVCKVNPYRKEVRYMNNIILYTW
tara:strand:+ start:288 stop:1325 length:1038 start_codon:yes stop_codon:yes gene_type:complete